MNYLFIFSIVIEILLCIYTFTLDAEVVVRQKNPTCVEKFLVVTAKHHLINRALDEKKMMYSHLFECEFLTKHIVNLEKRQYMHALILSAFNAAVVPDIKLKIVGAGMAVIGTLACDAYDTYCLYKEHWVQAAYHAEMANFFTRLSWMYTGEEQYMITDEGTKCFFKAIDNITYMEMYLHTIRHEQTRKRIDECIIKYKDLLMVQFSNESRFLSPKIHDTAMLLYEEFCEIISNECDSEEYDKLHCEIFAVIEWIEGAMEAWGIPVKNHIGY